MLSFSHFMDMGEMAKNQVFCSSLCFARPSLLCLAVLIPSLGFICFLSFEFFPFLLTISILVLSSILVLTNTMKNVILDEKSVGNLPRAQDKLPAQEVENKKVLDQLHSAVEIEMEVVEGGNHHWVEAVTETAQQSEIGEIYEYPVELFDAPSDSDESSVPSENFELSWMCSNNVGEKVGISDRSSVSDKEEEEEEEDDDDDEDDNLIEINLPGSESVGMEEKLQSNIPDFLPDSIFRQQGLRELLADVNEMNEEENLIEIDISMGSIKCPSRFEIEA